MENNKKNETGEQSSDDRNQNISVRAGTDNRNMNNTGKEQANSEGTDTKNKSDDTVPGVASRDSSGGN